jgi:hypothetical protein
MSSVTTWLFMVVMSLASRADPDAAAVKDVGDLRTAATVLGVCMVAGGILAWSSGAGRP